MEMHFDELRDRRHTGSCKFEAYRELTDETGCIPLTIADMEMPTAQPIISALIRAAEHGICGYTEADEVYINALSGFMERRHGLHIEKDNLICTGGIVPALGIIIRALTSEGDGIIVQPPVYTPFFNAININSRKPIENPLIFNGEKYVMDYEHLEKCCISGAKMLILCSPHNPVGRVWTYDELAQACEICKKHNVLIVCDEIHNDIILGNNKHISAVNLPGMKDSVITCTAMSKTFNLAGLMLSNIFAFNREIHKKLETQLMRDGSHCIPYFGRAAAIAAFTECDEWIDALKEYIRTIFELCYEFFEKRLNHIKCIHADGTYLLWVDCRALGLSDDELLQRFIDALVPVNPGAMFGTGGSGFVRVNIAMPKSELEKALVRMEKALAIK